MIEDESGMKSDHKLKIHSQRICLDNHDSSLNPEQTLKKPKSQINLKSQSLSKINLYRAPYSSRDLFTIPSVSQLASLTEQELNFKSIKLINRISELSKRFNDHQSEVLLTSVEYDKQTLKIHRQSAPNRPLKRQFNVSALIKQLNCNAHENKSTISTQTDIISKIKNRIMELSSEKYLLDITVKCEDYIQQIRKLQKILQIESKGHQKSYQNQAKREQADMMIQRLYQQLEIDKRKIKCEQLEQKIKQAKVKQSQIDHKIKAQGKSVQLQQQSSAIEQLKLKYNKKKKIIDNDQKNIKLIKSIFKNKAYILSQQNQELKRELKKIEQQKNKLNSDNFQMLERLKTNLLDTQDNEILQLASSLTNRLQLFSKWNYQNKHNIMNSDSNFVQGIIKLKRKFETSRSKHNLSSIRAQKSIQSHSLATLLPSLAPSSKYIAISPNKNTNISLTLTKNRKANQERFSYW